MSGAAALFVLWATARSVRQLRTSRLRPSCPHAHRHDDVARTASFAFDQCVSDQTGACHPVRITDRNAAAVDVVSGRTDSRLVTAVQHLACKCLVELPRSDVVDCQAMKLQVLGIA